MFKLNWSKSPVGSRAHREEGVVVLDETHKDKRWKTRLKGLYDIMGHDDAPQNNGHKGSAPVR